MLAPVSRGETECVRVSDVHLLGEGVNTRYRYRRLQSRASKRDVTRRQRHVSKNVSDRFALQKPKLMTLIRTN
jgi:hypothetical protein